MTNKKKSTSKREPRITIHASAAPRVLCKLANGHAFMLDELAALEDSASHPFGCVLLRNGARVPLDERCTLGDVIDRLADMAVHIHEIP